MTIRTPWAPLAFDWYADEEVNQGVGPLLWPWVLGRVIRGVGVVSEVELDPLEAARNLQLLDLAQRLKEAVIRDPELDTQAWVVAEIQGVFAEWQRAKSSRKQPLLVRAYSERDLGGRNREGGYGRNLQVKRGLSPKGFREWMGRFTKIEVHFGDTAASGPSALPPSSPPPPPPSSPPPSSSSPFPSSTPSQAGPAGNSALASARIAQILRDTWPTVRLEPRWFEANLPLLLRHGEENVQRMCASLKDRGVRHPNYIVTCLEKMPEPRSEPARDSNGDGVYRGAPPRAGALPNRAAWENLWNT